MERRRRRTEAGGRGRRWRIRKRESAGPPRKKASKPARPHRLSLLLRQLLSTWLKGGLVLLLLGGGLYGLEQYRKHCDEEFKILQTQLEMKAVAVLVRSNYAATGKAPEDLRPFLAQNLKKNKDLGAGKDFWGSDYLLEELPDRFVVRSPGPDRRPGTQDDLACEMDFPPEP